MQTYTNGSPGSSGAFRPVTHDNTDSPHVGEQPVVTPPLAARISRQQRRVLARVVGVRRGRVDAVVGSQDQQVVIPEQAQPLPHGCVDLGQRPSEPRDVVPVPIHLIGLYQVHEDQARFQLAEQSRRGRDAGGVGRAGVLDVDPDPGEQIVDLAHPVHGPPAS